MSTTRRLQGRRGRREKGEGRRKKVERCHFCPFQPVRFSVLTILTALSCSSPLPCRALPVNMHTIATPSQERRGLKKNPILSPFSFLPFFVLVVPLGLTRCDEGLNMFGLGAFAFDSLTLFEYLLPCTIGVVFVFALNPFFFLGRCVVVGQHLSLDFSSLIKSAQQKCREQQQQRTTSGPPATTPSLISLCAQL